MKIFILIRYDKSGKLNDLVLHAFLDLELAKGFLKKHYCTGSHIMAGEMRCISEFGDYQIKTLEIKENLEY